MWRDPRLRERAEATCICFGMEPLGKATEFREKAVEVGWWSLEGLGQACWGRPGGGGSCV